MAMAAASITPAARSAATSGPGSWFWLITQRDRTRSAG
jgi:hypothetical protein